MHRSITKKIDDMRRSKPYIFKKIYNDQPIFNEGNEIKCGYLNVNGILEAGHSEYLNCDKNLLQLNVLVIAETKLTENVEDSYLNEKLKEYSILRRFDISDNKKHMGFLIMKPREAAEIHLKHIAQFKDSKCQVIIEEINCIRFAFIYLRPNAGDKDQISKILQNYQCSEVDVIMGDVNLNPRISFENDRLKQLCQNKEQALNEVTTVHKNQLDHILVSNKYKGHVYVTSFFNFISDHKSIVIRIGENELKDEVVQSLNLSNQKYMKKECKDEESPIKERMKIKTSEVNKECQVEDPYKSLQGDNWLGDVVINAYGNLVQKCMDNVFVFSSFFYITLQSDPQRAKRQTRNTNIFTKKYVFFPIHDVNHWYLIIVDTANDCIESLDPLVYKTLLSKKQARLKQSKIRAKIMEYLKSLKDFPQHKKYSSRANESIPDQTNGHDCGVYMLMFMKYKSLNKNYNFTQYDMECFRKMIEEELQMKSLKVPEIEEIVDDMEVNEEEQVEHNGHSLKPPQFSNTCSTLCWLNSMIQFLIKIIEFTETESYLKGMLVDFKYSNRINSANQLRMRLAELKPELQQGQQDPFQFFEAISLFPDAERLSLTEASILRLSTKTKCLQEETHMYEHDNDFTYFMEIDVPKRRDGLKVAIEQALMTPELLSDWKCDICHLYGGLKYQHLADLNMPKFMIVKIKRGKRDEAGQLYKDQRPVDAAETILITSKECREHQYDLCGIITHYGHSIESGHYIAEIKQQNGWWNCNDSSVKETDHKNLSTSGYGYLYMKCT